MEVVLNAGSKLKYPVNFTVTTVTPADDVTLTKLFNKTGSLNVASFSGKQVHTWISCISQDGKVLASSVYTGELAVL